MNQTEFEHIAKNMRCLTLNVALRYGLDRDEAEDVAQDTMVRLWTMRDKLGQIRSPKAFVAGIARNMAIDRLRKNEQSRSKVWP